jgi:hypothetical protein
MSFNRLIYDDCSYSQELSQTTSILSYQLDPNRYYNCNACRNSFGLLGGNNVSIAANGNLVDIESDLKGIRPLSKCAQLKHINPCPNGDMNTCQQKKIVIRGTPTTRARVIDTTLAHLPSCQMIRYKPIPLPPALRMPQCPQ